MKKIHDEAWPIIRINTLTWLAISLKSVFIDLFIWRQTQSFTAVVVYNLATIIALFIIYPLTGYWLRRYSARTLVKLGNLAGLFFFVCLIALQRQVIELLIPFGFLNGISAALYWSGFNLHQYLGTYQQDRDYFFGIQEFWASLARVSGPIIAGAIVFAGNHIVASRPLLGYYLLFGVISLVILLATREAWYFPRFSQIDFNLSQIKHLVKQNQNFRYIMLQQFFWGLRDVSIGTIFSVLVYLILKQEFNVGVYNSLIGLVLAASWFIAGRIVNFNTRLKLSFIGAASMAIGAIILGLRQDMVGLIVFGLMGIPASFLALSLGTLYYTVADTDTKPWQQKYGYLVGRDLALGVGRVISFLILWWLFSQFPQTTVVKWWLIIMGLLPLVVWFFIKAMKPLKIHLVNVPEKEEGANVP